MTTKNVIIPSDYKDIVYRITYYFLGKVAPFIPNSIRPNQITVAAFLSALIGVTLLYVIKSPVAMLYWILFNFIWYLLDALDGIHARLTQQSSEFGGFLDHALDNIYFIFMFTVFSVKFDLLHVFYVYALCLRLTAAVIVFIVQSHTKRLVLSPISGGTEFILFSLGMCLTYLFPHFNPVLYTTNTWLLSLIDFFSLQQYLFIKLTFLVYAIGVPITIILQFHFVKRQLSSYKADP